ncbi:MAG: DUF4340 domain-containing protein [Woeseiaceae bacterium]|nr:DUF4340 domain-containing protein [Woeseiaceae bacterium]
MTARSTKILAIAAAVLLVAAVLMNLDGGEDTAGGGPLLPDFRDNINSVTSVAIEQAGERATILNDGERWVVRERDDYPADTGKLREALLALADATRLEAKTADPARHGQLGLAGAGSEDSTLVDINGDPATASLILGNTAQREYRYARLASEEQAWLIDENPEFPADPADWLVTELMDIPSQSVRAVVIQHADGDELRLAQADADDGTFVVENVPEGRELTFDGVANGIAAALQGLSLDDVMRAPAEPSEPDVTTQFTTRDGLIIVATRHRRDDESWYALAASVDPEHTDAAGSATGDNGEDSTEAEADGDEASSADERAAAIAERVTGWWFRLPSRKAGLLARSWSDILQPPPNADSSDDSS